MGASVAVPTLGGGQDFPRGARFFPAFPFNVTGKQVERIDLLWVRGGLSLRNGSMHGPGTDLLLEKRRVPSHSGAGPINGRRARGTTGRWVWDIGEYP